MDSEEQIIGYAKAAETALKYTSPENWAAVFVELRMDFCRRYQGKLTCSTSHGIDFFKNVIAGPDAWDEKGEYGTNFRKLFS